jgi:hypothetical protein
MAVVGCFLCGLSTAEALVLGSIVGALEADDAHAWAHVSHPTQVCPEHRQAIASVRPERLAALATQLTGKAVAIPRALPSF